MCCGSIRLEGPMEVKRRLSDENKRGAAESAGALRRANPKKAGSGNVDALVRISWYSSQLFLRK